MTDEHNSQARHRVEPSPLRRPGDFPPLSAQVQVEFGARSRRGRLRTIKADHYLIIRMGRHQETLMTSLPRAEVPLPFDEFGYGMMVADGVGDTGDGEAASRLAISTLVHLTLHFGKWDLRIDERIAGEVMARADRFYRQTDQIVTERRRTEPALAGMQTTLTAAYSAGSDCFFAHVGHSQAYLFRDGQLTQLTRDHTIKERATVRDRPPDVKPVAKDLQHLLTDAIGAGQAGALRVDVEHFHLLDRDVVLLCTNGLTDMVPAARIEAALERRATSDEHCQTLLKMALDAGAQDDITIVMARYSIPA